MVFSLKNLSRNFLIATHEISDSVFADTIIWLSEHSKDGARGFIMNINAPSHVRHLLTEKLKFEMDLPDSMPLSIGGPVDPQNVFLVHSQPELYKQAIEIGGHLYMSFMRSDIYQATFIEDESHYKGIFAGCCVWSPGQLESEVINNDWLLSDVDPLNVLSVPANERHAFLLSELNITMKDIIPSKKRTRLDA
ncbi:YqgE/AlgH family protein [Basilea psittacipulmonis]|uniref:Uncharacterized protein n=1 Tax=Basilea psittacipulmonis DSM 24701 TaxID=1072685 RepID=A0A077DGL9_9BURK|nr:YqgE/AlgH family protein [Basilea psittacipulmonis]AIL32278.1 hypothetical protein IX83_02170 [Basilea psittacipulmonis DSM 24701]